MDITVELDDVTLITRTSGIVVKNNKILLTGYENEDFYTFIGGRVNTLEDSESAIIREVKEEIGVYIKVNRLLWVIENFFKYNGKKYHEFLFVYMLVDTKGQIEVTEDKIKVLDNDIEYYKWVDLDYLADIDLKPGIVKERLKQIPIHTEHIINNEL